MPFRTRATMITWAPYSGRSEGLAQHLGIRNHFVHYLAFQRPWIAPLKYPLQAIATLRILLEERPAVVLAQNPPVVAPLVAALYATAAGGRFIVDSHSEALLIRRWRCTLPLQRWLARRALATVVTNEHLAAEIRSWKAPAVVAVDPPIAIPPLPPRQPAEQFTVVVVSTFADDEPIGEVLDAARALPDIHFAITGDPKYARPEWLANPPPNVEYTGFLQKDAYYPRIWNANAMMVLTTLDHTVLRGAWEALDLAQPLILSDWPILRQYFCRGTLHVQNTADSLIYALREARGREHALRAEMLALREERREAWKRALAQLETLIDSVYGPRPAKAEPPALVGVGVEAAAGRAVLDG
jgi:glycosyltransferase involved in cell wall biosynthesis